MCTGCAKLPAELCVSTHLAVLAGLLVLGFDYLRTTSSFPGFSAFSWPLATCRHRLGHVKGRLRRFRRDPRGTAREHHRHALRHRGPRQGPGRGGRPFCHLHRSGFRVARSDNCHRQAGLARSEGDRFGARTTGYMCSVPTIPVRRHKKMSETVRTTGPTK